MGCDALDKLTQFDMDISEVIGIEPTIPINVPFDIPTPLITLNTESAFTSNNTHKDLIEEIKLSALTMTVQTPADENFSLLKSIEIYIAAEGETEEKIAWLNSVPSDSSISLDISDADLTRFIIKDKIALRVKTITDEINTRKYEIRVDAVFRVNAKILGI